MPRSPNAPRMEGEEELMPRVCVFDLDETLLDLSAMKPLFRRHFAADAVQQEWFAQTLQLGFVSTITNHYADFPALARAALDMIAARYGVSLSPEEKKGIVAALRELPAQPEARQALNALAHAGIRVAVLTNSPREMAEAQLDFAAIRDCFDLVLSADTVRRLKPAPEPYRMAADRLAVAPRQVRVVAAQAWDVTGARRAGCAAAFVACSDKVLDPLAPTPDVKGEELSEVIKRIIAVEAAFT